MKQLKGEGDGAKFATTEVSVEGAALIPDEYLKGLAELGVFGMKIPRDYGGYGAQPDMLKSRIIAEEFIRAGDIIRRLRDFLARGEGERAGAEQPFAPVGTLAKPHRNAPPRESLSRA